MNTSSRLRGAFAAALCILFTASLNCAVCAASPTPAAAKEKVMQPDDLAALTPMVGQNIVVEGEIVRQGVSKSGTMRYLNFSKEWKSSVTLVFFASRGGQTVTEETLAPYVGKKVRASGELSEFQGALQIKIFDLSQIEVLK